MKLITKNIIYEDNKILLCNLYHNEYNRHILNSSSNSRNRYDFYFRDSIEGFYYVTLIDKTDKYWILNSETERVSQANHNTFKDLEFYLKQIQYPKIMILGAGSGYTPKRLLTFNDNTVFSFYEYIKHIKSVEHLILPKNSKFNYVDVYDHKLVSKIDNEKYDVIFDEIEYSTKNIVFYFKNYLKENGYMYFLSDWRRFPETPFDFLRIKKQNNKLILSNISNIPSYIINSYVKEISEEIYKYDSQNKFGGEFDSDLSEKLSDTIKKEEFKIE